MRYTAIKIGELRVAQRHEASPPLDVPQKLAEYVRPFFEEHDDGREHIVAVALDARLAPISLHEIAIGSTKAATLDPKYLFRAMLLEGADAVALAHNHPGGDPKPSREDRCVTASVYDGCVTLGIRFLDHLVVTVEPWRWHSIQNNETGGDA